MAFITNSIGLGGRNLPPDVTIIQWMLIRAQNNYKTNLFDAVYTLSESGTLDNQTGLAIKAIISYPRRSISSPLLLAPILQPQNNYSFSFLSSSVISPDDENYKFLLKCTPKPICTIPLTNVKIDFNDDPLVVQALAGTLNFQAFKSAVEAKDGKTCDELKGSNYCGVNPVTGNPGIRDDQPGSNGLRAGGFGNIRPGNNGRGGFQERSGQRHSGVDIVAPVGTKIVASMSGKVIRVVNKYTVSTIESVRSNQNGGYGNAVTIEYKNGLYGYYAHLTSVSVEEQTDIIQGDVVGTSGRTGNANDPK